MVETPNLDYIKDLAAGSEEFEQKVIGIIKKEFPEEKKEFLKNYNAKAYIEAAKDVHKLKHKIGMFGFEAEYKVTVDFEEGLKKDDISLYPKFILILESIEDFLKII
ncbi:Hpt domain-containing protein [uncultured Aquimarina sp.]|uniref:Hpt domain-containing protein n=1 Tax=uncultured Aquimarina sp. TaxID=575652 RepID=UPI0026137C74|nr:Hpt domain-containing protein [uncultured Aquimarina sp.]